MRWIKRLAALLGFVLVLLVALAAFYVQRSLPQMRGSLTLPGLSAPVSVHRDASDVTHILASRSVDAWMALGYVHAQERGWQLEFNRRVMRGELSEVLGPATLETDRLMRTLGIREAARAQYARLPPDAQAALQAYSAGINAFFGHAGQALTPEFLLLGIAPGEAARAGRYWDPLDSVGWSIMMALDLGANWGNEFARLSALKAIDTPALWELFPPYPGEAPASAVDLAGLYRGLGVYRETAAPRPARAAAPEPRDRWHARLGQDMQDWANALGDGEGKGSNNWVVAGARSATGHPLLANDPHLGLSAPAIWYFARLQAPEADGIAGMDVMGATLPGTPFVVLGRTTEVAWGFTNTGPDVQDLYLEQINPANPAQYRVPAPPGSEAPAWADFSTREEVIRVKGQADVRHTVRSTRHGPVLSDAQALHAQVLDTSRFVLALRWTALEADNRNVVATLAANRARSVQDLLDAFRDFDAPMQNVVMAERGGRIFYKAVGKIPLRGPGNDIRGVAPAPGWEARYDWTGWLPYEETPQDDGSARGWIATANQRIHGPDYPHFLTQDWAAPYRQERIEALLEKTPRHSMASFQAMHADQHAAATLRLLPFLQKTRSNHPLAAAAQDALRGFDGEMRADRAAPLIYSAWIDAFTRRVIGGRLGQERFETLYGKRLFRNAVEGILERDDASWCREEGGCAGASAAALGDALDQLQKVHGSDVAAWRWGDAHPAISIHRPFSNVKALARAFEVRTPTGGDPFTINVGQYHLDKRDAPYANRHAASLRAIYDLADLDNSRFIYQTGQSGNVFSSRYRDMREAWVDVRYRALTMNPAEWVSTLELRP